MSISPGTIAILSRSHTHPVENTLCRVTLAVPPPVMVRAKMPRGTLVVVTATSTRTEREAEPAAPPFEWIR